MVVLVCHFLHLPGVRETVQTRSLLKSSPFHHLQFKNWDSVRKSVSEEGKSERRYPLIPTFNTKEEKNS